MFKSSVKMSASTLRCADWTVIASARRMSDVYSSVRFTLIPGTREMYVSLNGQRARSLMVLQNCAAFAARGR